MKLKPCRVSSRIIGFPSLRKRVYDYIDNCLAYLITNTLPNSRKGEIQVVDNLTKPFQILHTDHYGPLKESIDGHKHILLIMHLQDLPGFFQSNQLVSVKSTSSKETIKHFLWLFNTFGSPCTLVLDRGTALTSQEFSDFCIQLT